MLRQIKNLIHLVKAVLAVIYFRYPARKMKVVGVTGTDGKSTTTHLLYHILSQAGKKVSMVSTIEAIIGNKIYDTGLHVTTPSCWDLQRFLSKAVKEKSEYFILEVTSHGLDQHRIFGIPLYIGLITNISHEHLDYHRTFENYRLTKAKIIKNVCYSVLNKDESNYKFLVKCASGKIISFAIDQNADFTLRNFSFKPRLMGKYNLYNCLAAAVAANILGIKKNIINKAISNFKGIRGRLELIASNRRFHIYIDFAHKPNALKQVLKTVRKITKKKLIVIFGCAGLRDRLKRPMMGRIAAKYADYVILTAEDPRTEDVRDIIQEISLGCEEEEIKEADKRDKKLKFIKKNKKYYWRIPDRQEAINFAIRVLAKSGDSVLVCGKGHEKSMCYGKTEFPWDEKQAIEKALYGSIKTVT